MECKYKMSGKTVPWIDPGKMCQMGVPSNECGAIAAMLDYTYTAEECARLVQSSFPSHAMMNEAWSALGDGATFGYAYLEDGSRCCAVGFPKGFDTKDLIDDERWGEVCVGIDAIPPF